MFFRKYEIEILKKFNYEIIIFMVVVIIKFIKMLKDLNRKTSKMNLFLQKFDSLKWILKQYRENF